MRKFIRRFLLISVFLLVGFSISIVGAGAPKKLIWDANTEPDLAGYKVYWGQVDKTGGVWPGSTEILPLLTNSMDVGNVTEFSIHTNVSPVEGQGYCFSVLAYDTSANESGFGEFICYVESADPIVKDGDPVISPVTGGDIVYE